MGLVSEKTSVGGLNVIFLRHFSNPALFEFLLERLHKGPWLHADVLRTYLTLAMSGIEPWSLPPKAQLHAFWLPAYGSCAWLLTELRSVFNQQHSAYVGYEQQSLLMQKAWGPILGAATAARGVSGGPAAGAAALPPRAPAPARAAFPPRPQPDPLGTMQYPHRPKIQGLLEQLNRGLGGNVFTDATLVDFVKGMTDPAYGPSPEVPRGHPVTPGGLAALAQQVIAAKRNAP
ncbi:hypothetical protein HXX76_015230 [Chlamydomonas incerta]|uniref:Uncharacterized protein n=1 Tax=Chlamydomonas incerta TaxID=51695 RepID=A0A835SA95_CHLIN|nr:hypothetical protein HXX76_015230 [Chlamydomonas incerta]|eukprot:KAG2423592.1 hypothetical protein HXX76_015230 [Chlamydomonas incerta]